MRLVAAEVPRNKVATLSIRKTKVYKHRIVKIQKFSVDRRITVGKKVKTRNFKAHKYKINSCMNGWGRAYQFTNANCECEGSLALPSFSISLSASLLSKL